MHLSSQIAMISSMLRSRSRGTPHRAGTLLRSISVVTKTSWYIPGEKSQCGVA